MLLLFNTLSRFVIAFLRRSKSLLISCHLNELQGDIGGTINDGNQWDADHLESFSPKEKEDESPSFLLISSSNLSHPWEDSHLPPTTHFPSRMLQLDCLFLMELENLFVHRAHFSHLLFWQGRCLFGIGINWDFHLWSDADGITEKWRQRKEREDKRTSTQPSYRGTQYSGNSVFLCPHILPLECVLVFLHHTDVQMLSVPWVHVFPFLSKSNYFCSHFPLTMSFFTLLGCTIMFWGLCTKHRIFSGSIVLPVWSQRSLSLARLLSLSPFLLPVLYKESAISSQSLLLTHQRNMTSIFQRKYESCSAPHADSTLLC